MNDTAGQRLAVCIKACENIPTEVLEEYLKATPRTGLIRGMMQGVIRESRRTPEEREARDKEANEIIEEMTYDEKAGSACREAGIPTEALEAGALKQAIEALEQFVDAESLLVAVTDHNWGLVASLCRTYDISQDRSADAVAEEFIEQSVLKARNTLRVVRGEGM